MAGFMVNEQNVLEIGRAFEAEAGRMEQRLVRHEARMRTEAALGDPASRDFAPALNQLLVEGQDSYLNRARAYVAELLGVARQCRDAALAYGYTEDEIAQAMRGIGGYRV
ncbi:hypothetical protein BLA60_02170 [Actinophytocola xinjiangensis]|uniref:Excreted virulence factor EspC (Type VII ESX diderm) n=1 Tax=Actinophytocola xinjiangensis TaxID=485602 RepID=A0A7Z1B1B6_9PSEU|nr:hypothetical protein [Actinophytocola xinjiangensis]OLF14006.1 hypothetical protein BLA60_02170 [Actinophytocola xinjiangensis]